MIQTQIDEYGNEYPAYGFLMMKIIKRYNLKALSVFFMALKPTDR
jgi:hypothetical protein